MIRSRLKISVWALPVLLSEGGAAPSSPRVDTPAVLERAADSGGRSALYTLSAQDAPLRDVLRIFSKGYGVNVIADSLVSGTVSFQFKDLPLEQALDGILQASGYSWAENNGIIQVSAQAESTFVLDYVRLIRSGSSGAQASVSSNNGSGSADIKSDDNVPFWTELEEQVRGLMSPRGKLTSNRTAGMLHVRDRKKNLADISGFLAGIRKSVVRQVEITTKIYEVSLKDDKSLGIDWEAVNLSLDLPRVGKLLATGATSNIQAFGEFRPGNLGVNLQVEDKLNAVVSALRQQGEVQIVSQPSLLTLNNQPALIKVGTDQPFFSVTIDQNAQTGLKTITEKASTITIGVVLSLTPQIAEDGWIMLQISPTVSSLVGTVTSTQGGISPIVDVKQSSSLIRVRDKETVRISGLIHEKKGETVRKVPLLGDIPIIGSLFRWKFDSKEKRELVIFITPQIRI